MFQFFTRISFVQERLQMETLKLARIHICKLGPTILNSRGCCASSRIFLNPRSLAAVDFMNLLYTNLTDPTISTFFYSHLLLHLPPSTGQLSLSLSVTWCFHLSRQSSLMHNNCLDKSFFREKLETTGSPVDT